MIKLKVYRVVGERREEYFRRKESRKKKVEKLREFFRENFPELGEMIPPIPDKVAITTNRPELWVEEHQEELIAKLTKRGDLKSRKEYWDKKEWIVFVPEKRRKAGKELYKKWKEITNLPEWDSYPEFLQVDRESMGDFFGKSRYAFVHEENREVILYAWDGFNPEELEGFEPAEAVVKGERDA